MRARENHAKLGPTVSCTRRNAVLMKTNPEERPPTQPPGVHTDPTPTEELVAQWVSTKGGAPSLVFCDTGSQVTLVTHKAAQAIKLPTIFSSPLRLEGIGDGHR
jgi:hypothetical protein